MIADEHRLYLDGNSLGRLPKGTRERLHRVIDQWGDELVGGWPDWIEAPTRTGDALAEVLGASPGQVLVTDSTTVNLYKLVNALLDADPSLRTLVTDAGQLPDRPLRARGDRPRPRAGARDLRERRPAERPAARRPPGRARRALATSATAAGALADMEAFDSGTVIWDLSHSAGAVPVDLNARGIRYAVGCTYKYLNAGPGAAGYLYVARAGGAAHARSRAGSARTTSSRWSARTRPRRASARFMAGTPPILVLAAVEEGVRITAEAGIEALREKSIAQTELMIALHDEWLTPLGFTLGSPRDPRRRGSHVSLNHPEAWPICRALIERADVVPDFRGPDSVRLGIAPLYTRFVDVWDAMDRLRDLVERGVQREVDQTRARVT